MRIPVVVLLVILSALDDTNSIQRSVGTLPEDSKYSFMVGIIETNIIEHTRKLYCIGTFIRNSIILTPSHCLSYYYKQNLSSNADEIIYYAQYSVNEITVNDDSNLGTKINRGQVHFHPNYHKTKKQCNDFDVALIKLSTTSGGFFPSPIDLCQEKNVTHRLLSWINHAEPNGPYKLNFAEFKVLNKTVECTFKEPALKKHHICTVGTKNSRSSNGDSGSPLIQPKDFCQFGMLYCIVNNYVLFVNVAYFTDWIDTVEKLNIEIEPTTEITSRTESTSGQTETTSKTVTTTIEDIHKKSDSTTQKIEEATKTSDIDTATENVYRFIWIGVTVAVICIVAALLYFHKRKKEQRQPIEPAVQYTPCETEQQ